jgi:hypothetical protein
MDLLSKLLDKNPQTRIGTKAGASEIKRHAAFKDVHWKMVFERKQVMPDPYLAKIAFNIIKNQPYLIQGHPST